MKAISCIWELQAGTQTLQAGSATMQRRRFTMGPVSVDTDLITDASSTFHYALEFAWRKGPFIFMSEYIQSTVRSITSGDPTFNGYNLLASYIISGEMRGYNKRSGLINRVEVANGVNSGGWGTLEIYGRWSSD
jgi:phosphate-selective porin OprO/OprP